MKRRNMKPKDTDMAKTVLVADDSPTIRKIVEICLAGKGIKVLGAASGSEAVAMLKKSVPDLVLADSVMPGPDGYELCERIKLGEFGATPPVVLMADVLDPFDTNRASACGADGEIAKPFEAATLQLMVSDQLGVEPPPAARAAAAALKPYTARMAGARMAPGGDALPATAPQGAAPGAGAASLSESEMDSLARRIVGMMSADVVREVAWEVVPELSEVLIKERLQKRS